MTRVLLAALLASCVPPKDVRCVSACGARLVASGQCKELQRAEDDAIERLSWFATPEESCALIGRFNVYVTPAGQTQCWGCGERHAAAWCDDGDLAGITIEDGWWWLFPHYVGHGSQCPEQDFDHAGPIWRGPRGRFGP